jgi:hypothetical protein
MEIFMVRLFPLLVIFLSLADAKAKVDGESSTGFF